MYTEVANSGPFLFRVVQALETELILCKYGATMTAELGNQGVPMLSQSGLGSGNHDSTVGDRAEFGAGKRATKLIVGKANVKASPRRRERGCIGGAR